MESKPESKINHPIAILAIIVIIAAIGIHFGNVNRSNTTQETSKPAIKAASKEFANSDVTDSTVKDALKKAKGTNVLDINSKKEFKSIDVVDASNGKTVTVIFKPQVKDETDLAKKSC